MTEAPQQNEVDFSCHFFLLGSVTFVEKSSSISCAEGSITGLIFIALFPPSAQSAHCTKLRVCSRTQNGSSVSLSVFRESAVQVNKCRIKYHFYKKHLFPEQSLSSVYMVFAAWSVQKQECQSFGLTLRILLVDAFFGGSSLVNWRQMNACE